MIQVVVKYIDAVQLNTASALPLHPDAVCEFPMNTYRGTASFQQNLDQFARIVKSIDIIRVVVDGKHSFLSCSKRFDEIFGQWMPLLDLLVPLFLILQVGVDFCRVLQNEGDRPAELASDLMAG